MYIVAVLRDSVDGQENVQNEATFSVTGNPDDIICYDAGGIALVYALDNAKEKGHSHKMILCGHTVWSIPTTISFGTYGTDNTISTLDELNVNLFTFHHT